MTIEEAVQRTIEAFPFDGYMTADDAAKGAYSNIASVALSYLEPGSSILDFGSGPCEKAAILQFLGFTCSAYDDLQDEWHKLPGNRERIASFAQRCGVSFTQAAAGALPFAKSSFDMVMLHDVLEHLHDSPRDLLNDLLELTTPGGLLFVTVPNAANIKKRMELLFGKTNMHDFASYYWYPGPWRGHNREYVHNDLVELSAYLDLDVLELRGCDHMLQKVPRIVRPAYLLATRLFQGWKDSWLLVARKKARWSPRRSLPQDELIRLLGRSVYVEPKE